MIELEAGDDEYGMDYLARANSHDKAADKVGNIEFVRRRACEK